VPLFCEAVFRFSFVFLGKPILETSLCFINFLSLSDSLFVTLSITTRGVKYLHNNTFIEFVRIVPDCFIGEERQIYIQC